MTVHIVTSPRVISRKNANLYLAEHIVFPKTVTSIEEETFLRKHQIKSVVFPENLTCIGARAFQDCIHIRHIKLPSNLMTLGKEAFSGCNSLASVNIPSSIKNISDGLFYKCRKMKLLQYQRESEKSAKRPFILLVSMNFFFHLL